MSNQTESAMNSKPITSVVFGVSVVFWAATLGQFVNRPSFSTVDIIALISGTLFVLDLLCIVWWYTRYIYRIQATASFGTYSLDFFISSMFALGAISWSLPQTFLLASLCGSVFLLVRFVILLKSPDASLTDRRIMFRGCLVFLCAAIFSFLGIAMIRDLVPHWGLLPWDGHSLPVLISSGGIALTLVMRDKINVAVSIYAARHTPIAAAPLDWPASQPLEPEQRRRIRDLAKVGLAEFQALFEKHGKHDRIRSRVHSDTDLLMQSYILAVPSSHEPEHTVEITNKAFMVAASHWLDDLIDGRNEVFVRRRLLTGPRLSDDEDEARALFEHVYRPLVTKHTSKSFYAEFLDEMLQSCTFAYNRNYLLLGLNRVAYGSVVFSPKIGRRERFELLDRHNVFLRHWNAGHDEFSRGVERLLDEIAANPEAGHILLGLTTKTVQEVALSSEIKEMNIGLSILLNILYAPLIYYHNVRLEIQEQEMLPLQSFDIEFDLWLPWLARAYDIIRTHEDGDRSIARLQQIEMAYLCFEEFLPTRIRNALGAVLGYSPSQDTEDAQAARAAKELGKQLDRTSGLLTELETSFRRIHSTSGADELNTGRVVFRRVQRESPGGVEETE